MSRSLVLPAWLLMAGGLSSGCSLGPRIWKTAEEQLSFPAEQTVGLSARTHNGSIRTTGEVEADTIRVVARKTGGGWTADDAREALEAIEIVSQMEGDVRTLTWRWREPKAAHWGGGVSFDIQLPQGLSLIAESHNGGLTASNLSGAVKLSTHNGGVHVSEHHGADLVVETHNGGIQAESSAVEVTLVSYNGAIDADLSGAAAPRGRLQTHNGAVKVDLADEGSISLTCDTHNGGISTECPVTVESQSRGVLRGRIGAGEGRLAIETHNGSIRIK